MNSSRELLNRLTRIVLSGSGAVLLAGCAIGPNYKPLTAKDMKVPEQFAGLSGQPATQPTTQPSEEGDAQLAQWWTQFNDPKLESLIMRGLSANYDVKTAEARVRAARAALGVSEADLYPTVNVNGSYSRNRNSTNLGSRSTAGLSPKYANQYRAGFDATWELDLFGGTRRGIEAATADLESTVEDKRNVLITLAGDVATNYITYRGLQRQLTVAYENLRSQNESVDLTQRKFNAGLTSELDVVRARAQVATTASTIPTLEQAMKQTLFSLSVLLGQEPNALATELSDVQDIPKAPMEVPAGLPSDLLRRRPDVRRAERALAAAVARIGESQADLFPRFSLTGDFGWQSSKTSNLFSRGSNFWSVGPGVSWPIFDANRIRNQVRVRTAEQEQALFQYEQAVLVSLRDVENSLVALAKEQSRRASLSLAVDANKRAVDLANQLYTRGLGDFLSVITAEQSLFSAQDQLARSDTQVSTNLVALYKALGGGWEVPAETKK